ncbi:hypothetical protein [Streptomyces syringium]|uniref:hypothetical protein n=1 Tax=Streptomyces syringium TaxID=76729 RepID=UPI0033D15A9D
MALSANDLLPGEVVQVSKNANVVITVDEVGLSRFAFDQLMWMVGLQGKEAIGGRLYVTNYRLVFNSHPFNRLRGRFSIFFPLVAGVRDTSSGIKRQIELSTGTHRFTFVVWGVPALIAAIDRIRQGLGPGQAEWLARAAVANSSQAGEGLRIARRIEAVNIALRTAMQISKDIRSSITPDLNSMELADAMGLVELLECAGQQHS